MPNAIFALSPMGKCFNMVAKTMPLPLALAIALTAVAFPGEIGDTGHAPATAVRSNFTMVRTSFVTVLRDAQRRAHGERL